MKNLINRINLKILKNPYTWLIIILILIGFIFRVYNIGSASFWSDESASSLAGKGILEHGTPVLPSGNKYYRALPFHYLMAFSFAIFGFSDFSARLVSVLFGVLIIPVIYKLGKEIGGKNTGVLAAVLVTFSFWNIWQSRQARFYQQFQFFTILSIYFFYLGFIKEEKKYKYLTFPALVLCIFTHQLTIMLIPAFFVYLLFNKKKELIKDKFFWIGCTIVPLAFLLDYLIFCSSGLAGSISNSQINGTDVNKTPSFCFSIQNFFDYLKILIYPNILIGLIFGIVAIKIYLNTKDKKLQYLNFMFWIPFLFTIFFLNWTNLRYIFYLWSTLLLIVSYVTINYIIHKRKKNYEKTRKKFIVIVFTILLTSHLMLFLVDRDIYYYNSRADFRSAANFVKDRRKDGDKIVAIDPTLTYYYLEQCDYYLKERWYTSSIYEKEGKFFDKYIGAELIDNLTELKDLLKVEKRVWFIFGDKYPNRLKDDIINFIEKNLDIAYESSDGKAKVFLYENSEK